MQSKPTEVPQNEPVDSQSPLPNASTQHGFNHGLKLSFSPPAHQGAGEHLQQQAADIDNFSISSGGSARGQKFDGRRLKDRVAPYFQDWPGSHVDQYEKLHGSMSKRRESVCFEVIPSITSVEDANNNISIDQFPNEILTHVLSHLQPSALSAMSLVSRRFHSIVTTPHAWRIAFHRFFPGQHGADTAIDGLGNGLTDQLTPCAGRRVFGRLTALASWRSEYILRTRLLRSLGRGKPANFQSVGRSAPARCGNGGQSPAVVTYSSNLVYPVTNIHATFGYGINRKMPRFMHGAAEYGAVTVSDPSAGKVAETWGGNTDYSAFRHFEDGPFAGESMWGLGTGDLAGVPNSLDLSYSYGKIYGEGIPGGRVFFTPILDRRGVFLPSDSSPDHELGIPDVNSSRPSVCCTWIAKSEQVLKATNGIFGLVVGYSNGTLAAHALGASAVYDRRFEKGESTAKWVLSPGVPIIAIQIDGHVSSRRQGQKRLWAVALNALGEVFLLTDIPSGPESHGRLGEDECNRLAWQTGRSVQWSLVESTRRVSRPDPFHDSQVDASYSPRSSSDSMGLSHTEIKAEIREVEIFLAYKPHHFQKLCEGWDMRRRLLVDFAGDDLNGAGESIFVLTCGLDDGPPATIRRIARHKVEASPSNFAEQSYGAFAPVPGSPSNSMTELSQHVPRLRTSSPESYCDDLFRVEWRLSDYTLGGLKGAQILATATDDSQLAVITASEDPLLGMSGGSNMSSPTASPLGNMPQPSTVSEIPGQRARLMAVGTATGVIYLWNMRVASAPHIDTISSVPPVRMIYTESPQISCLALTSLYLVHGGNDGLVQAWDPLSSSTEPVRTLNSRFSSRARRRLIQAESSVGGVGNNYYAAGAIALDPDPTVLRGMVSLGTHLRYWSYSSSAADLYKGSKRRLRQRSKRGGNAVANEQRFTNTGRGVLKDYIAHEIQELEREQTMRRKERERMTGRFGTDLLGPGASEEDMLAYATMLSEESYNSDELKRRGSGEDTTLLSSSTEPVHEGDVSPTEVPTAASSPAYTPAYEDPNADVAEAIRLSLLEATPSSPRIPSTASNIAINDSRNDILGPVRSSSAASSSRHHGTATIMADEEVEDLELALQLSLTEG